MATEIPILMKSAPAAADLSSYQYYAMRLGSSGFNLASTMGKYGVIGILQNAPDGTSETASVMLSGLSKAKIGGTVTLGDPLTFTSGGKLVKGSLERDIIIAQACESGVNNDIIQVCVSPVNAGIQPRVRSTDVIITAAQLIALNTTPKVLVDHSQLVTDGEIASGDVLMFLESTLNVYGGTANYDQNQNTIVKYQTAGGGATVSTTLANFFNGAAAGSLKTIKQLVTDITPEADQDLVLTSSASPKSAAGDRLCKITTLYYVYTPGT